MKRFRLSRAGEFRALGDLIEKHEPGRSRFGRLLERSIRIMETQEQEYIDAYLGVENSTSAFYVTQETTRAIVADCWAKVEETLQEANVAFNATADEPFERIAALNSALVEAQRYTDVILTLTPVPDDVLDDDEIS